VVHKLRRAGNQTSLNSCLRFLGVQKKRTGMPDAVFVLGGERRIGMVSRESQPHQKSTLAGENSGSR